MADFSVKSTQLSAPQGAGANPLPPVQETITNDQPLAGVGQVLSGIFESIGRGQKQEAQDRKSAAMQSFARELETVNQGVAQGKGTAWGAAQMHAAYGKYLGSYGDLASDLKQVFDAFQGTSLSQVDRDIKSQESVRQSRLSAATAQGHTIYPGMSKDVEEGILRAADAERRLEYTLSNQRSRNADARAQSAEERAANDYRFREEGIQGLTAVASANFDLIQTKVIDLREQVSTGKMGYQDAQAVFLRDIEKTRGAMLAISARNPEMAAPWINLINAMSENGQKLFDPAVKNEKELAAADAELKLLMNRVTMAAAQKNPQLIGLAAGTKLLGPDIVFKMTGTSISNDTLLSLTSAAQNEMGVGARTPNVVNTTSGADVFKGLKAAVSNINNLPERDKGQARIEALNATNNLLKQTADSNTGAIPTKSLNAAADFYASRDFYELVKTGKLDMTSARNAQQVFQSQYVPLVQEAIVARLNTEVSNIPNFTTGTGETSMRKLGEMAEFTFTGNTVEIKLKSKDEGGIVGPSNQTSALKEAMTGLNTMIRLHANLSGTDNYEKFWNDNKHMLLPNYFPDPAKLKEGDVVNGKKYLGGNYRDPSNWQSTRK